MGKRKQPKKYAIYALAVVMLAAGSIDSAAAANWFKLEGISPAQAPLLNFSGFFIPLYKYMNGTAAENGQIPRFNLVAPQDTSRVNLGVRKRRCGTCVGIKHRGGINHSGTTDIFKLEPSSPTVHISLRIRQAKSIPCHGVGLSIKNGGRMLIPEESRHVTAKWSMNWPKPS